MTEIKINKKETTLQQQVQCIFRWRFTVDICLARGEPLHKKNPCQRQWINDGLMKTCSSSCSICTLMKPLKWLNLLEKKVNSESDHGCNRGFCLDSLDYGGRGGSWYSPPEAIAWFRLKHGITVHSLLSVLIHTGLELHWFALFSSRGRWAPTKDQWDGVLKWAEF